MDSDLNSEEELRIVKELKQLLETPSAKFETIKNEVENLKKLQNFAYVTHESEEEEFHYDYLDPESAKLRKMKAKKAADHKKALRDKEHLNSRETKGRFLTLTEKQEDELSNMVKAERKIEDRISRFEKWVKVNSKNSLYGETCTVFARSDKTFGVKAIRDIGSEEPFLFVDNNLVMTTEYALIDPELNIALNSNPELKKDKKSLLMLMAWHELTKEGDSFWLPYLRMLPQEFNLPIFFPFTDLSPIKERRFLEMIEHKFRFVLNLFVTFYLAWTSFKELKSTAVLWKDFEWAASLVYSRGQKFHESHYALIPIIDFFAPDLNAKDGAMQKTEKKSVVLSASKGVSSGSELFLSESQQGLSTFEIFVNFGFIASPEQVPNDFIFVDLSALLDKSCELYEMKKSAFESYSEKLGNIGHVMLINRPACVSDTTDALRLYEKPLSFARICAAYESELKLLAKKGSGGRIIFGKENERRAIGSLLFVLMVQLKSCKSVLETTVARIDSGKLLVLESLRNECRIIENFVRLLASELTH